jgi:integrase
MRKSRQRGWIELRGKKWYGYFRKTVIDPMTNEQRRMTATGILGLQAHMDKAEAREILDFHLFKQTGTRYQEGVWIDSSITFGWFVRNRFFPLKEGMWRVETAKVKKLLIERDLIDSFDTIPLKSFDKFRLQIHLNNLAKEKSRDRVLQIRAYLRDIFAEAEEQGFLTKDPARRLRVPAQLCEVDKTILTWEQLREVLSRLSARDRILLELGMTNALRPSEMFALKWRCFNYEKLTITLSETVYKGKIRPWGKTPKSMGAIHITQELAKALLSWKQQCPTSTPDKFIFSNGKENFIDADRFRKQLLRKLANELQLPKLTFQVIRRTIATRAQTMGSVKDIQGILRHSSASTTADVYMQEISEGVQMALLSISNELRAIPSSSILDQTRSTYQPSDHSLEVELVMSV